MLEAQEKSRIQDSQPMTIEVYVNVLYLNGLM